MVHGISLRRTIHTFGKLNTVKRLRNLHHAIADGRIARQTSGNSTVNKLE